MPKQALAARGKRRRDGAGTGRAGREVRELDGREQELFETLRTLRRGIARELALPPYLVFSDASLEEMARQRPLTAAALGRVHGVGPKKLATFGERFLGAIRGEAVAPTPPPQQAAPAPSPAPARVVVPEPAAGTRRQQALAEAAALFRAGVGIDLACSQLGRAVGTVTEYLVEWIEAERPASIAPWVAPELQARISAALRQSEDGRLKPVFDALGGEVPYEAIRITAAFLRGEADAVGG
jgi:ATP-dependent DNA helicase RecQ